MLAAGWLAVWLANRWVNGVDRLINGMIRQINGWEGVGLMPLINELINRLMS